MPVGVVQTSRTAPFSVAISRHIIGSGTGFVILAELWSCGPVAARSPHDGVEALDVLVQGTTIPARTRRAALLQHRSHCHRATAYRRDRVSIFTAINHPSASRNLCQNQIIWQFTQKRVLVEALAAELIRTRRARLTDLDRLLGPYIHEQLRRHPPEEPI